MQEERGQRTTTDYDEEDRYGAVIGTGAAHGGAHDAKTTRDGAPMPSRNAWAAGAVPASVKPPPPAAAAAAGAIPKPAATVAAGGVSSSTLAAPAEAAKMSTLSANAKPFTLKASAPAFVPAAKKPVATAAPTAFGAPVAPGGYPGYPMGGVGMNPAAMYAMGANMGMYGGVGRGPGMIDPRAAAAAAAAAAAQAAATAGFMRQMPPFGMPPGGRPPAPMAPMGGPAAVAAAAGAMPPADAPASNGDGA